MIHPPAALTATAPPRRSQLMRRRGLMWLTAPAVIWFAIFTIGPLVALFVISTFEWTRLVGRTTFIGLENFFTLPTLTQFQAAVGNTAIHLIAVLPFMMVVSFMFGYYLNLRLPGHRVLRVLMFAPALISVSALGTMFIAVLGPKGLINGALDSAGLSQWAMPWLAREETALLCIILITIWSGLGFNAVLFAARLAAIPSEIGEAATVDGAGHWRQMWSISFPIASDYFGVLTMLQYLWTLFGSAGLILLLTNGGPGTATTTLSWMVYQNAFITNKIGQSQAVGVLLFVVGLLGVLLIRRVFRARS